MSDSFVLSTVVGSVGITVKPIAIAYSWSTPIWLKKVNQKVKLGEGCKVYLKHFI